LAQKQKASRLSLALEIARTAAYLFCMRDDFVNARIINLGEERQTDQTAERAEREPLFAAASRVVSLHNKSARMCSRKIFVCFLSDAQNELSCLLYTSQSSHLFNLRCALQFGEENLLDSNNLYTFCATNNFSNRITDSKFALNKS